MVAVAPVVTGITFVFMFHVHCISIVRSLYFLIFLAFFLIEFPSPEIATSINICLVFVLLSYLVNVFFYLSDVYGHVAYSDAIDAETGSVE